MSPRGGYYVVVFGQGVAYHKYWISVKQGRFTNCGRKAEGVWVHQTTEAQAQSWGYRPCGHCFRNQKRPSLASDVRGSP